MKFYRIEIQGRGVQDDDRERAESAIESAIEQEGLTAETFAAAEKAFLASNDGMEHDEELSSAFDRIQSAGNIALTEGWHDPNGADLMLSAL